MYGKSLEPGNGDASLQVKIVCRLSLVVPAFTSSVFKFANALC